VQGVCVVVCGVWCVCGAWGVAEWCCGVVAGGNGQVLCGRWCAVAVAWWWGCVVYERKSSVPENAREAVVKAVVGVSRRQGTAVQMNPECVVKVVCKGGKGKCRVSVWQRRQ